GYLDRRQRGSTRHYFGPGGYGRARLCEDRGDAAQRLSLFDQRLRVPPAEKSRRVEGAYGLRTADAATGFCRRRGHAALQPDQPFLYRPADDQERNHERAEGQRHVYG